MGIMQRAMLLWMMDAAKRDAVLLHESISGLGTKDTALIGIVCTRTSSQSYIIKQAYYNLYHRYFAHVFTPCTHLGVLDCHWGLNTFQQNKRHAGFGFKSHCE